jgi:hypothetical protein
MPSVAFHSDYCTGIIQIGFICFFIQQQQRVTVFRKPFFYAGTGKRALKIAEIIGLCVVKRMERQ